VSGEKVKYDPQTDILVLSLSHAPIKESDEIEPGLIVDYDAQGKVVGIELLDASEYIKMSEPATTDAS
jgi:uncharacterized protein YuzE